MHFIEPDPCLAQLPKGRCTTPITRDCCAVHTGFLATNSVELDSVGWGRDSWPQDFIAAVGEEKTSYWGSQTYQYAIQWNKQFMEIFQAPWSWG